MIIIIPNEYKRDPRNGNFTFFHIFMPFHWPPKTRIFSKQAPNLAHKTVRLLIAHICHDRMAIMLFCVILFDLGKHIIFKRTVN